MCLFAFYSSGLQPSTTYDISVQSVRGEREGKASSVMGITGTMANLLCAVYRFGIREIVKWALRKDISHQKEALLSGHLDLYSPLIIIIPKV